MSGEMQILREKIYEARHNESIGFGLLVLGLAVAFAGLFQATITETRPIVEGYVISHPYVSMALVITILGLLMTILGSILVIHSAADRSQNMKKLEWVSCPKCGKKLESKTKYCQYCGIELM